MRIYFRKRRSRTIVHFLGIVRDHGLVAKLETTFLIHIHTSGGQRGGGEETEVDRREGFEVGCQSGSFGRQTRTGAGTDTIFFEDGGRDQVSGNIRADRVNQPKRHGLEKRMDAGALYVLNLVGGTLSNVSCGSREIKCPLVLASLRLSGGQAQKGEESEKKLHGFVVFVALECCADQNAANLIL